MAVLTTARPSLQLCVPLICYDHIKEKALEIVHTSSSDPVQLNVLAGFPYRFFVRCVYVDTTDFSSVSYGGIAAQVKKLIIEVTKG
jgi:hypothetical protein